MSEAILKIENLVKHFPTGKGKRGEKEVVKAVEGISFELKAGETIGLVGESGCGKTTAGRTILKLVEPTSGKIIFEDKDIILVNKAPGMVVHPAHGNWNGTLVNGLLYHCQQLAGTNEIRPGLVHRIDKDTSGLLVVAKTDFALTYLAKQFYNLNVNT